MRRYQEQNPYFFHWRAKLAYSEDRLKDAKTLVRRAIRLKSDEHLFYHLEGLVYYKLGDRERAARSFTKAIEHAIHKDVRQRYNTKLDALIARH